MAKLYKILFDGSLELKDSGSCSQAIRWNDTGNYKEIVSSRPVVGCSMLVGSPVVRTYENQDYWLTTEIVEILEDNGDIVRFRTKNSKYEWRA